MRNIWLLLLYASQLYRELPAYRRVDLEDAPDRIPDLVAEVLAASVERRLRRSLSQDHRRRRADISRVRGRIDLLRTERRQLLRRGSVACVFDELTVDTPRNRCVRAALMHIAGLVARSADRPDLQRRCRDLALRLQRAGVVGHLDPRRAAMAALENSVGWVDPDERRLIAAAMLALSLSIPIEQSGPALLPLVNRSETTGWDLYERAVAGFYATVLRHRGWSVRRGGHIHWPVSDPTPGLREIMPRMATDIVLERRGHDAGAGRRIVIDTKFTSIMGRSRFGKQTLRSGHIYQLYAYLRSQERDRDAMSRHSAGVLLYPSLGADLSESAVIQGHRVSFATVNLAADSRTIRRQLLSILDG